MPDHDPDGKADPLAYQEDFLREAAEAADAGLEPADEDRGYIVDEEARDALWRNAEV